MFLFRISLAICEAGPLLFVHRPSQFFFRECLLGSLPILLLLLGWRQRAAFSSICKGVLYLDHEHVAMAINP